MKKLPVAIQMFSLREDAEKDFIGTLRKVAELGYEGVEFAGYGGLEAIELKKVLSDFGLKAAGAHVSLELLEDEFDQVVAYQKTIGNNHIVCPSLPEKYRKSMEQYEKAARQLNEIGKKCVDHGIVFSYHNHDFELKEIDGVKPLAVLLNGEYVHAELDIYWLKKAGENPYDWLEKYKHKAALVHIKDMTKDEEQFFTELGTGSVNLPEIIQLSQSIEADWLIVEQDVSRIGALKSAKINMDYLKENYLL